MCLYPLFALRVSGSLLASFLFWRQEHPPPKASHFALFLLSPVAKFKESLLLPKLQNNITLADHQHQFHKNQQPHVHMSSSEPALKSVIVALYLSRALSENKIIDRCIRDIHWTTIAQPVKSWLAACPRGRQTSLSSEAATPSASWKPAYLKVGLSPILSNLSLSSLPNPPEGIVLITYANDGTVISPRSRHGSTKDVPWPQYYLATLYSCSKNGTVFQTAARRSTSALAGTT